MLALLIVAALLYFGQWPIALVVLFIYWIEERW